MKPAKGYEVELAADPRDSMKSAPVPTPPVRTRTEELLEAVLEELRRLNDSVGNLRNGY